MRVHFAAKAVFNFVRNTQPRGENKNIWIKSRNSTVYRQQHLTENSLLVLDSLLKVARREKIELLKSLLIDNSPEIYIELRKKNSRIKFRTLQQIIYKAQDELGFVRPKAKRRELPFEKWSDKFQKQWETYETYAEQGIPDNNPIARLAIHFKVSVKPVTKETISDYKKALQWGFYYCHPFSEDWGVEDLLSIEPRTVKYAGIEQQEFYNEFVDHYRIREQNRSSESKRVGYDSSCFS